MKRKIIWEKWVDPFGSNLDDVDLPKFNPDKEDTRTWRDSYEETEAKAQQQQHGKSEHNSPVLVGPIGIIPLNEHNIPSRVFNFWMGHTNFKIDEATAAVIEDVLGVETLEFFTSYRFRMAVGKAFDFQEVRQAIEKAIEGEVKPRKKKVSIRAKNVELLKRSMKKKYPFWAIVILPKGEIQTAGGETQNVVEDRIASYKEIEGIKILTSW